MAFLNKEGLEHLWDNIIYKLSEKADKEYVDNAVANAGGGGGGAPSDWNENDETSPAYVKNRTHYTESALQLLLEEVQVQADSLNTTLGSGEQCAADYGILCDENYVPRFTIDLDKIYVVTYDNVEYRLTPYADSFAGYIIGRRTDELGGSEEKPPFAINYYPEYSELSLFMFELGTHTIKIESEEIIFHKLDPKYISEDVQGDWNQSDTGALDYIKNKPFGLSLGKMLNVCCDATIPAEDLFPRGDPVYEYGTSYKTHPTGAFYVGDYTYEVIIDGVSYYTSAHDDYYDYLGSKLLYDNSEYPFSFYYYGNNIISMAFTTPGPHTVKIIAYEGGYEFKQIDEKFIPDTIARMSDIQTAIGNAIGGSY